MDDGTGIIWGDKMTLWIRSEQRVQTRHYVIYANKLYMRERTKTISWKMLANKLQQKYDKKKAYNPNKREPV